MQKKRGLYAVLAAIAVQLTLGIAYIWSVFQNGIAYSIFKGDHAASALTFSLFLMAFTIGSVIGGKLAAKLTIRRVVIIGGIVVSAGFFLASFVTEDFAWFLWATYGLMGGAGMGFTYSTTIACAQKWYPHKRGLVSGIIVSSLGFGGVVFTPIVEMLIKAFSKTDADGLLLAGTGELSTFTVLSVMFLVVCIIGSLFMKDPPDGYMMDKASVKAVAANNYKDYTSLQMLKTPRFYLVTVTLFLVCMGGLMMMGFAKPIAEAKGLSELANTEYATVVDIDEAINNLKATASIGVIAITLFNSIGRLLWGWASDKLGRLNTLIILLAGSTVLSLLVDVASGYWLFVLIALIGFSYGGILGIFPSLTSDLFGAKHMAANYGFILLGFGIGAITSSQIAGHFRNVATIEVSSIFPESTAAHISSTFPEIVAADMGQMFPAFIIASCCAAAGTIMMVILKFSKKKEKTPSSES